MLSRLFDTLLEPTFILNSNGQILYTNEVGAQLFDTSVRKLIRQSPRLIELVKFAEQVTSLEQIIDIVEPSSYQEVSFTLATGKEGRAQITVQPFTDSSPEENKNQQWLVFFRDVTLEATLQKKYRKELEQKEVYINELQDAHSKLSDYSKNLESMVQQRTAQISSLNTTMKALLDSLGQGFFIFQADGKVLDISSRACETLLEQNPCGKNVWDVLKVPENKIAGFKNWLITIFNEMLPFEDLAPLGPASYSHSKNFIIQLSYNPIRDAEQKITGIVVVATDMTSLVDAQKQAESEKAHVNMILQIIRNKRQLASFIRECEEMLKELHIEFQSNQPNIDNVFRLLHTMKGGAATFSVKSISDHCHHAETLLNEYRTNPQDESLNELRKISQKLSPLFSQFLNENEDIIGNLQKLAERWIEVPASKLSTYAGTWLNNKNDHQARQVLAEEFLFEKVGDIFSYLDNALEMMADRLGKKIDKVQINNPEFKILPEPYENLFTSLIHAFRNSIDHGIETPEVRQKLGKKIQGKLQIGFDLIDSNVLKICIQDDGSGISAQKIREKLKARGIDTSNESDELVIQHIFDSNFSTREEASEFSGRGVGMDAIAHAANLLGGTVFVKTKVGEMTEISINVPWIDSLEYKTSLKQRKIA